MNEVMNLVIRAWKNYNYFGHNIIKGRESQWLALGATDQGVPGSRPGRVAWPTDLDIL